MLEPQQMYDCIIENGLVVDGSGQPGFYADVAIMGERIAQIGDLKASQAKNRVDGTKLVVAPGFIDVHTHDDASLIIRPEMTAKLSQGVTLVVCGNCGISGAPLDIDGAPPGLLHLVFKSNEFVAASLREYMQKVSVSRPAINAVFLTGHTTLRMNVMGDDLERPATAGEIAEMKKQLVACLEQGAIGLSSGLFYQPAHAAPMDEVIAIAAVLKDYEGIYTTHMRDEADGVLDSLNETLETGRAIDVPVIISHHKCQGQNNFGRSVETLALIEAASKTQNIALDVYPYTACSTVLEPEMVDKAVHTLITWSDPYPEFSAKDLSEVVKELGCSCAEAIALLQPAGAIYFMMDETDVKRIMCSPGAMIGSDGLPEDKHPHPRLWGTFPRVLGRYVREQGIMSLEQGIHRMTGLSAGQLGIKNRGLIEAGYYADLTIFNAETINDNATFECPTKPASGIEYVFVNGKIAWENGGNTKHRAGRVLRRCDLRD